MAISKIIINYFRLPSGPFAQVASSLFGLSEKSFIGKTVAEIRHEIIEFSELTDKVILGLWEAGLRPI